MTYFKELQENISYMKMVLKLVEEEVAKAKENVSDSNARFSWFGRASKQAVSDRLVELRRCALKAKKGL